MHASGTRCSHAGAGELGGMTHRLRVDPIRCTAHGMCAELFPERIALDEWGYPIISDSEVPEELLGHARRAVAACPDARPPAPARGAGSEAQ